MSCHHTDRQYCICNLQSVLWWNPCRHLISCKKTYRLFVGSKEENRGKNRQGGAINSVHRAERKNRVLIEPAIAISHKDTLLLKAQVSYPRCNVLKTYFMLCRFKVLLAVVNRSYDIFYDRMRKLVSQAAALGCQGNICESGECNAVRKGVLRYMRRGK